MVWRRWRGGCLVTMPGATSIIYILPKCPIIVPRSLSFGRDVPLPTRDTPTERLYTTLFPNLPQYMIALLKMLLAAAPSRSRNSESLNILGDVLPPENPANVTESNHVTLDINRHKEIIVKAISAILLLLLKHFKVNYIHQFEYLGQHLVFANCVPLVLKFFNQNVMQYVASRNNFPTLNFPQCVLSPLDAQATGDIGEGGREGGEGRGGEGGGGGGGGGGGEGRGGRKGGRVFMTDRNVSYI